MREENCSSRLLVQVHDELLLDCPPEEVNVAKGWVSEAMEHAVDFKVPMKTHASTGSNWMELK